MSKLFNCWSSSSYSDTECGKEIEAFLTCANQSVSIFVAILKRQYMGSSPELACNVNPLNAIVALI